MFHEQLVATLGPIEAETLLSYAHDEAKVFVARARKHFSNDQNWLNNEGGMGRLVQNLCCHAIAAPSWQQGFDEYWRQLKKEYRYDNRHSIVSLDNLVAIYGEYAWEAEGASSPLAPFEGFALSEYAPKPQDVGFWNWLSKKDDKFQEVLWTWCDTRDHVATAELTGVTAEYSRHVYRVAKEKAIRPPKSWAT